MNNIPADVITKILELRAKNGLEATPQALAADLEKSKAKWTMEDTPRYRRAGDSPVYMSGKYLTAAGTCPATGESDSARTPKPTFKKTGMQLDQAAHSISEEAFLKVLHGKGFSVKISKNLLTGEIEREVPASIEALGLKFSAIPSGSSSIHVTQTSPQIHVAMSLDRFLEVAGISANSN